MTYLPIDVEVVESEFDIIGLLLFSGSLTGVHALQGR